MTTATKSRKSRKKVDAVEPVPVFKAVHAASVSVPIFDALVRDLGEPNLNPYPPDPGPDFGLTALFAEHKPSVSVRALLPAWAQDTGQYLMDRMALADYVARMAGEEGDNGADIQPIAADGSGGFADTQ